MRRPVPAPCKSKTAIHFFKRDPVDKVPEIERVGMAQNLETGAFFLVGYLPVAIFITCVVVKQFGKTVPQIFEKEVVLQVGIGSDTVVNLLGLGSQIAQAALE